MAIWQGRGTLVSAGEESTYGTAVSRTIHREVISLSLQRRAEHRAIPTLGVQSSLGLRRSFQVNEQVAGTVEIEACYEGVGIWLKHALGSLSSAGGGAPYTHTYAISALPTGLTIEAILGGSGNSEVFEGCKITSLDISGSVGDVVRLKAEIIGETGSARSSAPTPTLGNHSSPVLHHQGAAASWNSGSFQMRDFAVRLDNGLTRRQNIGSLVTASPTRSAHPRVTGRLTVERDADALYNGHIAGTQSDLVLVFTDGSETFTITIFNALITKCDEPISGAGDQLTSLEFEGFADATNNALEVEVVNADSSGIAA